MKNNANKNAGKNKLKCNKKDSLNLQKKFPGIFNKEINMVNKRKSKYSSKIRISSKDNEKNMKINSYSSSHDNKKEAYIANLKHKIGMPNKFKYNFDIKKKNINDNSIIKTIKYSNTKSKEKNKNKSTSKSKEKINNINISKNNNKKYNSHYSFFLNDFSNKYKRNLNSFNVNSDSLINTYSITKTNSTNKTLNSKNILNIGKNKSKKNENKNNNINNIKRIIITNENKLKENLLLRNNKHINNKSNSRKNFLKNKTTPLSNKTSKEKQNVKKDKTDKTKIPKKCLFTKKSKYIFESSNNSISKNRQNKCKNIKKKQINQKINSRNYRYNNPNISNMQPINNNMSTVVNIKHIDNKIMNYIELVNKNKKIIPKKVSNGKYNTFNSSPNHAKEKNDFLNLLNISKIIYENNLMKEKNENLSLQIVGMTKEFENMKKENIIIKKELQEKSKMIKDMKLTIDIFNQELNKLQKMSKKIHEGQDIQNHNNNAINMENYIYSDS